MQQIREIPQNPPLTCSKGWYLPDKQLKIESSRQKGNIFIVQSIGQADRQTWTPSGQALFYPADFIEIDFADYYGDLLLRLFLESISLDPICVTAGNRGEDKFLRRRSILWTTILSSAMERSEICHLLANHQEETVKWSGIGEWWIKETKCRNDVSQQSPTRPSSGGDERKRTPSKHGVTDRESRRERCRRNSHKKCSVEVKTREKALLWIA
jgi:hypothetical protein